MARRKSAAAPDLEGFRAWLTEYGLSDGTLSVYLRDVALGLEGGASVMDRLRSDELAPKTKRHMLAACRHWAKYTKNERLTEQLDRLRLPAPRRKTAKVPLPKADLFALVDQLSEDKELAPAMRGVIGMMVCRGLRCGDVLRLRRTELAAAKTTGTLAFEAKGRRRLEFKVLKTYRKYLVLLAEMPGSWERVDELVAPRLAAPKGRRRAAAKAIERALVAVGVRAGIRGLYPHRLRRTYAVEYLRAMPGDPEALMKLTQHMQWATMATAMEYVDHVRGDELNEVADRIFDRGKGVA